MCERVCVCVCLYVSVCMYVRACMHTCVDTLAKILQFTFSRKIFKSPCLLNIYRRLFYSISIGNHDEKIFSVIIYKLMHIC